MTSSESYYLIGPIKNESGFILTYSLNGVAYFLTLVPGENNDPDDLIFDPRSSGSNSSSNQLEGESKATPPLVFRVNNPTKGKYALSFEDSDSALKYVAGIKINNRHFAGPATETTNLVIDQTEAAPWPNIPFLAGVHYKFKTVSNKTLFWKTYQADKDSNGIATSIKMKDGKPVISSVSSGIRVVPSTWLRKGSCTQNNDIRCVINNEIFWVAGETGQFFEGFTDPVDSSAGVRYAYCPPGKTCSVSCKGPCPNKGDNDTNFGCFFDTTSEGFKCEDNPRNIPWYRNEFFISLAIGFGLIVIVLIIFIIFRFTSSSNKK